LHSRSRNNPFATFLNSVSNNEGADVSALSEASIDNRVVGFRPLAAGRCSNSCNAVGNAARSQ
jgi:hypothetical protein